jgi:hypothetical protein
MVYLNTNCDRMSHDHLRYDRRMTHHRGTNLMDVKIPDVKMKNHHVNWWKSHCVDLTIDPECYYPKTDDLMKI